MDIFAIGFACSRGSFLLQVKHYMEAGLCCRNGKAMSGYALRFTVGVSEPPSALSSHPCSSSEPDKVLFPQGVGAGAEINQDQLWMLLLVQIWWKKLCNSNVRSYKMSVVVVCASLPVWDPHWSTDWVLLYSAISGNKEFQGRSEGRK